MFPENFNEVLPLLDGDADITRPWLTGRALMVLPRSSTRAGLLGHHKDLGWSCTVRRCPRHRTGRFVNVLSTSVVVAEVDVIELPVDHD